ncbi:hypothetical protein HK101_011816 [Irineochytrium annulatum]|nr:hypothetical protein HK101_011816 [Irineochytrium annulatum]
MPIAPSRLAEETVDIREAARNIGKSLVRLERRATLMLVAKVLDPKVVHFTRLLACHLIDTTCSAWSGLTIYVDSKLHKDFTHIIDTHKHYADRLKFWSPAFCAANADIFDFIVTLGGDGTVLYTSWLFQHSQVPPVIPFHLGSLGFLANFDVKEIRTVLKRIIGSEGVRMNMRMRLSCTVWRYKARIKDADVSVTRSAGPVSTEESEFGIVRPMKSLALLPTRRRSTSDEEIQRFHIDDVSCSPGARLSAPKPANVGSILDNLCASLTSKAFPGGDAKDDEGGMSASHNGPLVPKPVPTETFQILNDLVVDRGPSPFMSQLELFVDDRDLTTVQADGLVVSTPTGSTAYALSAGGSIVHPEVPSILVTPICPHTLSFRPMLLPDGVELKVQVPKDSRSTAWASFDGRHRIELKQGDFISITMSRWPMPTVCSNDQSTDWFESLRRCLHWNERVAQKPFGAKSDGKIGKEGSASRDADGQSADAAADGNPSGRKDSFCVAAERLRREDGEDESFEEKGDCALLCADC